ncbi:MAG: D-alanyl-lipoteichoic acid biosynthesis protein DltD [Streptococcaceae bacterium]|jgi:D-alanine transfer protein|nr:D-alanyl-lipoteichoic acid biosynthesis protein DltD [Streptococcaceae bacterium]
MRKISILKALGPLFCAFFLVFILLFTPFNQIHRYTEKETDKFAVSPQSVETYIGNSIKHQAFANKKYLPIMGSSELARFDPFHPSVLADKYQRSYTPFLIGFNGTHSLAHYFYMDNLNREMKGRKLIFIISPQWFKSKKNKHGKIVTNRGINSLSFDTYITLEDVYRYIKHANPCDKTTKFMTKRLLSFPSVKRNFILQKNLILLSRGKKTGKYLATINNLQYCFLKAEDSLFQKIFFSVGSSNIKRLERILPSTYSHKKLDRLACKLGAKQSKSNPYEINDKFFKHKIVAGLHKLKNFQAKTDFLHGVEYNDLQLLLNLFAQNHNDVLFVIPPINGRWMQYTGLRQSMMRKFSKKIKYQLNLQGFNNIVDFVDRNHEPYFMYDTIHLGKRGWVALDQEIIKFMNKTKGTDKIKIDNQQFLSKKWLKVAANS